MKSTHGLWLMLLIALVWCGSLVFLPLHSIGSPAVADQEAAGTAATTALFGHVAIGQGYTTVFSLFNTGSDGVIGNLILTGQDGLPLRANLSSSDGTTAVGSSIALHISPGGATFVTATPLSGGDSTKTGWARVESSGGKLGGVATFQYAPGGPLLTIAGVPSSTMVSSATIPVNDDVNSGRVTGYAVGNPGSSRVTIKVMEVSRDGASVTTLSPIDLAPGQQIAKFLYQDPLAKSQLQGSAVLIGESGATFTIVALVMVQGASGPLFTTIPVAEGTGIANPIGPGVWHASTAGMSLDFTVNSSADGIAELMYTFSGLNCGGVMLASGRVIVSRSIPWPISNRKFLITPSGDPNIEITGTFGNDGTTVSGTWRWLTCSGTWTGSLSTQKTVTVAVNPAGASISGVGTTRQFTVEARDAGGSLIPGPWVNATWTSLNPNVATIDPLTGVATAVGNGQVTIRIEVDGVVAYGVLTVTTAGLPRVNLWARLDSGISTPIASLWGTSAADVYAAAHQGGVLHFNGTTWSRVFGAGQFLNMAVWGSSSSDVYVVGRPGMAFHYDGTLWSLTASGMSEWLSGMWGASPRTIYAVSWDGSIAHFDGTSWKTMRDPTGSDLHGVWGTSANDVYAVGQQIALHYDGTSWKDISAGVTRNIEALWGVSGTDIYAAGVDGNVFHYDGTSWTRIAFDVPISIRTMWGSSNTDLYFVGADTLGNAAVLHYDGSQRWTLMRSTIPHLLNGIWGAPTGEVFACGSEGTVLRGYRGGSVAITPSSATIAGKNNQLQLAASAAAGGIPVAGVSSLWTSSDAAVAAVDEDGLVTGLASGTATITATAFGGAAATATITVALTQKPPAAVIDSPAKDMTVTLGETAIFQGTATDLDGTITSHSWDFGDGTGANVEDPGPHTYTKVGRYRVTYRVTDNDGASSLAAIVFVTVVLNQSPAATITSPTNGASFVPGTTIAFTGSGTDHEDGTLTGNALVWTSNRDGQIGTGTSFTRNDLSAGSHTITLTASDSSGATGTATVTITVAVVAPIVPGAWHGSTTGMSLDFVVNPSADGITQIIYSFSGLKCGGTTLTSGSITVTPSGPWPISNRQFLITRSSDPKINVTGTFGSDGATVTGTWNWSTCSGTWTGSLSTQKTPEPQIP